jgi:signal transduction histidine kinase
LVALKCEPGLPVVWADHDRMEQVFVNLLNNAFGHNPPETRVQVTATAKPEQVVISVRDDGRGMPPELAAAPFEPGRRPSPSRKSAGAGLGLSIAKGIVQAHGGTIELIPQTAGTCFNVSLPVEAELLDASRTTGPHPLRDLGGSRNDGDD